ncbi:MAG: ABC-F family ATP-binding cassette domain-containing protein [Clostridia bacterium]|nr:ABC-F family ATP-binding cassette domain-containing protein [Clostridia bacterium]
MIEIELNNVKINYGSKNILDGVSFEIKTGERVSLIGTNASGKSTLFNIISGNLRQDFGTVDIRKDATIGYLKQIYGDEDKDLTVESYLKRSFEEFTEIEDKLKSLEALMEKEPENIEEILKKYGNLQEKYIATGGYELEEKFKKICGGFNFDSLYLKMSYNTLSGGEKTIVNLAAILLKSPSILLLDEPTNHLDISTREILEDTLKEYKGTILFVSHDRYFTNKLTTREINLS